MDFVVTTLSQQEIVVVTAADDVVISIHQVDEYGYRLPLATSDVVTSFSIGQKDA